jgi:hypothetical protein
MRIELEVNLQSSDTGRASKDDAEIKQPGLSREDRWLRRIALARAIEARISSREFTDLADVARRCGVSRSRVSVITAGLTMTQHFRRQTDCPTH